MGFVIPKYTIIKEEKNDNWLFYFKIILFLIR